MLPRSQLALGLVVTLLFLFFDFTCGQLLGGSHQTCDVEGERVNTKIPKTACFDCQCKGGLVVCPKLKCPSPDECWKLLPEQIDECCPMCKNKNKDAREEKTPGKKEIPWSCMSDGRMYKDGEKWNTSSCESCACSKRKVVCKPLMCPATKCPPGWLLKVADGQCCPGCEEQENSIADLYMASRQKKLSALDYSGLCILSGSSRYRTFDRRSYSFLGTGLYHLAADCEDATFEVRMKTDETASSSIIKSLSLRLQQTGAKLELQDNGRVLLNDQPVELPHRSSGLDVSITRNEIQVIWSEGKRLRWKYPGRVELELPASYKGKMCGLCGDFDDRPENDLTTREDIPVDEPTIFAESWTVDEETFMHTRRYKAKGCDPQRNERLCNYMRGAPFHKCSARINVTSYYEKCLKDMCECQDNDRQCHCDSMLEYARDCRRLRIPTPRWRRVVGCARNQ